MLLKLVTTSMLLVGCSTPISERERLASEFTPRSWQPGRVVRFDVQDLKGQSIGQITLKLTIDRPEGDCVPSNWYKANVIDTTIKTMPLSTWYQDGVRHRPAYEFVGRNLVVVLNPWVCDNDVVLRGAMNSDGATGEFASEAMLGADVFGRFVATFVD